MIQPFHLAIPVHDIEVARHFYGTVLGCSEGRSDTKWIDFNFFGRQLVIHIAHNVASAPQASTNKVDNHDVPIPHFGVVLTEADWKDMAERLRAQHVHFELEPGIRFEGLPGEQHTMFFLDPSGNALEFKCFKDMEMLFAK